MSGSGRDVAFVTQYIRNLRGGSQPILARASDGLLYVVKFNNNLQGANLPFNESAGTELYRACGLAVPSWRPLMVSDAFLDRIPDCWMHTPEGRLRPESGMCFGSRFLGGDGIRLFEILPGTSFKRVRNRKNFWRAWLIDICAGHTDNRQAVFQEDSEGRLDAFFIDHGHMFSGPKGDQRQHFRASRYLDPRIYQSVSLQHRLGLYRTAETLDADRLWCRVDALPDDWKTPSAIENLAQCLGRLSTRRLIEGVVDTMVDSLPRKIDSDDCRHQYRRKPTASVLHPGVQGGERERLQAAPYADHSAYA